MGAGYSYLSATIGLMRVARHAGIQQAISATLASNSGITANVRVGRAHAKEQALYQPRQGEGSTQTDDQADERQPHALTDDELEEVARLRAVRQADAHLARAFGHGIRQHTVDPDRGHDQREHGEKRQQRRRESF